MGNKVGLIYEDGKYTVTINGSAVDTQNDFEKSLEKFKQVIKNNANASEKSWLFIEDSIRNFGSEYVEINSEFKTISIGQLKYFYNTGKTFYISENNMTPLVGGYELVKFIAKTPELQNKETIESLLELCKIVVENKANYRTTEESLIIFSAALNYGLVEYNFNTKKLNKGVAIENGTFEEFKKYVLSIIKR